MFYNDTFVAHGFNIPPETFAYYGFNSAYDMILSSFSNLICYLETLSYY